MTPVLAPSAGTERVRFSRRRVYLIAFVAYTLLGAVDAPFSRIYFHSIGKELGWLAAVVITLPGWWVRMLMLPGILWLTERFPLDRPRWRRNLLVHLVGATASAAVFVLAASFLSDRVLTPLLDGTPPSPHFVKHAVQLFMLYYSAELAMYGVLVGVLHAAHYSRLAVERERAAGELAVRAARLEAGMAHANLRALSMQLRPHFLFNTLNAVTVLAMKGETARVVLVLGWLGDLLRASLRAGTHHVTLRRELGFIRRYLAIERVRFGAALRVRLEVDPETLGARVPAFVLQPMVENAVRHGIARRAGGGGRIRVRARRDGEWLELSVRDNGPGFTCGGRSTGTGVGLSNTRARLEQLYGSRYTLHPRSAAGGAEVTVRIPWEPSPPRHSPGGLPTLSRAEP
jgi:two-component system LytT family sensor kinase